MEPVKYQGSAPSVQLLNEIDILLTQVRLAELYLKQAQAATADQVARVQERYESELENLRAAISQKERSVNESSPRIAAAESLHLQIQDLQARVEEQRRLLEQKDGDFRRLTADLESSRSQITQLQSANDEALTAASNAERVRQDLQTELGKLRDEIAQKTFEIQQHQVTSRESGQLLQNQLRQLQDELVLEQARVSAKESDLEQQRADFKNRVAELQTALGQKDRALQEHHAAIANIQRSLEIQIHESTGQLDQKQALLESREVELQQLRLRLADLQARIGHLKLANQEAAAIASDFDSARGRYETDLEALRDRLDRKDQSLAEQQAAGRALEESRRNEIAELQNKLAQNQSLLDKSGADLRETQAQLASLQQRIPELQAEARSGIEARLAELETALAQKDLALQERDATVAAGESDLAALRAELSEKDRSLAERQASLTAQQTDHQAQTESLKEQLAHSRGLLESKDRELQTVRESAAELQANLNATIGGLRLELAEKPQPAESHGDALARAQEEFDNRLRQKDDALLAHQVHATELQDSLNSKISELQTQLREKQRRLESTTGEIADLKASVSGLSEQLAQLASAARDAELHGAAELERARLEHQAGLLDLREELRGKQHALAEQEARATELERRLGTHISDLETQLAAKQGLLEEHEEALNTANSSVVALQERYTRLEASSRDEHIGAAKEFEHVRRVLEAELAGLRNELQQKDRDLAQRQAFVDHLAQKHENQIQTLEATLVELRHVAENRATELDQASSQRQQLLYRIGQLESAVADAEATAISRDEQLTQRYKIQMAALHVEIEQKTVALEEHGATRNDLERSYHVELSRLRAESQEQHRLLESRNEEFLGVKNAMDSLRERMTQLEEEAAHAEQTGAEDQERLRVEYEAQLAALREELSQRERSDKDQGTMETAQTKPGQNFYSRSDRRWRSSGGWKRRWKT